MKSLFFTILVAIVLFSIPAVAQRNIDPAIERDPILELDAKHNLDVAWQSFRLKKAYKGVIMRFEETYAAYPEFSKIEEFLYLAGMSSYYLSENKGKQKVNLKLEKEKDKFAPAKLKEDAIAYLSLVLEKNPASQYKDDAEKVLTELKAKQ
ncbi:MAG: outer membrane protein assembly factor BamD [Saprospiraceae bacterium]|nr:outer membrane protein assembly factor BamD [Pyrinomonadaceae bacterium]